MLVHGHIRITSPLVAAHLEHAYRLIVEGTRAVTRARLVQLNSYDVSSGQISTIASSGLGSSILRKGLAAIRAFAPGFDPARITSRADQHEWNRRVYLRGEIAEAPLDEVAMGVVPGRIIQLASSLVGMQHSYIHPLKEKDRVFGSLAVHGPRRYSATQKRAMALFARLAVEGLLVAARADGMIAREREGRQLDPDGTHIALQLELLPEVIRMAAESSWAKDQAPQQAP